MKKKHFLLYSMDEKLVERLTADDLMMHGLPRSTAYRAIKNGYMPKHRIRNLQFRIFGDMPGWEGWKILPGKLIDPTGRIYEPTDLENLAYLQRALFDWDL